MNMDIKSVNNFNDFKTTISKLPINIDENKINDSGKNDYDYEQIPF